MTLGILKVAAVLEQAGLAVEMLDLSGVENYEEVVRDHVRTSGVACYGFTAPPPQMPAATKIYKTIRACNPKVRIILGGPHVTLIHAASKYEQKRGISCRAATAYRLLEEMFDVLVVGDGELAVFEALGDTTSKLVDADDPKSDYFLNNQKLTDLPVPARPLVDVDSYHYTIDGVRALSMIAQLGCPFGCGFCGGRMSPFLRRVRMRTSENIVKEMVQLYQTYGVTGFMLYDDELNVNPKIVEHEARDAEGSRGGVPAAGVHQGRAVHGPAGGGDVPGGLPVDPHRVRVGPRADPHQHPKESRPGRQYPRDGDCQAAQPESQGADVGRAPWRIGGDGQGDT